MVLTALIMEFFLYGMVLAVFSTSMWVAIALPMSIFILPFVAYHLSDPLLTELYIHILAFPAVALGGLVGCALVNTLELPPLLRFDFFYKNDPKSSKPWDTVYLFPFFFLLSVLGIVIGVYFIISDTYMAQFTTEPTRTIVYVALFIVFGVLLVYSVVSMISNDIPGQGKRSGGYHVKYLLVAALYLVLPAGYDYLVFPVSYRPYQVYLMIIAIPLITLVNYFLLTWNWWKDTEDPNFSGSSKSRAAWLSAFLGLSLWLIYLGGGFIDEFTVQDPIYVAITVGSIGILEGAAFIFLSNYRYIFVSGTTKKSKEPPSGPPSQLPTRADIAKSTTSNTQAERRNNGPKKPIISVPQFSQ